MGCNAQSGTVQWCATVFPKVENHDHTQDNYSILRLLQKVVCIRYFLWEIL